MDNIKIVTVGVALMLVSCMDADPKEIVHPTRENLPAPGSPVIRSAAVPAELAAEELATWEAVRDALLADGRVLTSLGRLGTSEDREAPDIFGFETDVAMDRSGQLVVLDRRNYAIKVFKPTGEHVGSFGRAGPGPGEFLDPQAIEVLSDGRFAVVDRGNRINMYAPSDSGYSFLETHRVEVVPEKACSAGDRVFSSGWRMADNTMIHEVPISPAHAAQHFGRGYESRHWIVQDQLSDGPVACLEHPARVVLAFARLPVVRSYDANTGTLLWESLLEDYLQPPVVEQRRPEGQPRVFFPAEGERDMTVSLTPVDDSHVLLQTMRGEPVPDRSVEPEIQIRSYLIHASSGQGALISDTLPVIALITEQHYVATWLLPFPRLEVRRWASRDGAAAQHESDS